MRTLIAAVALILIVTAFSSSVAAQNNPVPFVNNPLVPEAVTPGGAGFTLTVNGAGFVNGAMVSWNGSARVTTFVSPTKVTAQILASDIAVAASVFVAVSNPAPGGGISNSVFFQVTTPTTSLAFNRTDSDFSPDDETESSIDQPAEMITGNFAGNYTSDLAIINTQCPIYLECVLSKGDIDVLGAGSGVSNQLFLPVRPQSFASRQGNFVVVGEPPTLPTGPVLFDLASNMQTDAPSDAAGIYLGDFNRDGVVDVAMTSEDDPVVYILLGNSDGTFNPAVSFDTGTVPGSVAVGVFNGDGILDLAVSSYIGSTISILLGNGDGTFQSAKEYSTVSLPEWIVTADFNNDGRLDLATAGGTTVSIFLGNGDGTFQSEVDYTAGLSIDGMTIGDYNGDGVLDLAVTDLLCADSLCPANSSVNVLLGNPDGTFKSPLDFATGGQSGDPVSGEFRYPGEIPNQVVGRPGFAVLNDAGSQSPTVSVFTAIPSGSLNPIPTISSISPASASVNSGAFTLTVAGTNFISGSMVYFGGQERVTTFVSATQLTAAIQAGDVANAGAVSVFVANPTPGGGGSTYLSFNVYAPPPTISSLSPSSVVAGGAAFTLTVNGSNFVNGATVNYNGTAQSTTFVNNTQLTIAISASDIAGQGTVNISVTDPAGNGSQGGTTSTLPLTILPANAQPVVGGLFPASATAGGPAFTLVISGSGFTANSIVTFNSTVVSSAFESATQLQASIPASLIPVGGTPFVTVANPGGNPSVVVSFTVNNPVPSATGLSFTSVPEGNPAATVAIVGTNFNTSSTVYVNGSSRATTYVSSTSLSAALTTADFAHNGNLNVTVDNPAPGGGNSSALTIVVEDFKVTEATASNSVAPGQTATFSLMIVPANNTTANPVTFTVSGLPTGTTATFSPAMIPAGSGSTPVTLTITTTPNSFSSVPLASQRPSSGPQAPALNWGVLALALLPLGFVALTGLQRHFAPQTLLGLLLIVAAGLVACGGSSPNASSGNQIPGTPAGTYSVVVTASAGNGSLSTTVTLTVM